MNNIINSIIHKTELLRKKKINEECTKNYLVLPFFSYLGYDVTSPNEIEYEYICDMHEKGNRKVDCAIIDNKGHPYILIEIKPLGFDLYNHIGQLKTYFISCVAKYAILTDGNKYVIFTRNQIDGDFFKKGPAYSFQISNLNNDSYNIINMLSKHIITPEYVEPFPSQDYTVLDHFDLFCLASSQQDFINLPTNIAYCKYIDYCKSHNIEAICLINWSKMIKKRFNLKIVDKRVQGVKCRVFLPENMLATSEYHY